MDYEIVKLEEKILVSSNPVRLSNSDNDLSKKIELVWHNFSEKCGQIENKITGKPICTYSNYESDEKGKYDISIGYEVRKNSPIRNGWIRKIVPAGNYAKFIIRGNMVKEISSFWRNIWKMNLPRKFDCDFEECQNMDMLNAEVHVYISLAVS